MEKTKEGKGKGRSENKSTNCGFEGAPVVMWVVAYVYSGTSR